MGRHLPAKLSRLMLSQVTPSITLRQRFRIRKEFHQINNVLSLQENNLKMAVLYLTTIFKRSLHSILSFVSVEVCRSLLRHSLVKLSRLMLSQVIPSIMLRLRFKTKKESHQINNVLSLQENSSRMVVPYLTTIFKRSLHSILCYVSVGVNMICDTSFACCVTG